MLRCRPPFPLLRTYGGPGQCRKYGDKITQTSVTNAVDLSFLMVNVSHCLLRDYRHNYPEAGVLDLKTFVRSRRYVAEVSKSVAEKPDVILIQHALDKVVPQSALFIRQNRALEVNN